MDKAKATIKRIWGWIDRISTAAWLFAIFTSTAVLGALYSFVEAYRDLPLIGQLFFGLATFAGALLSATVVVKRFWSQQPGTASTPLLIDGMTAQERLWYFETGLRQEREKFSQTENDLRQQLDNSEGRIRGFAAELESMTAERDRFKVLADAERAAGKQRLREVERERDALSVDLTNAKMRLQDHQENILGQSGEIAKRDGQISRLKPYADWADGLIERERATQPIHVDGQYVWIHQPETLREHEPRFELRIGFQYLGVCRVILGREISGALARYQQDRYNHDAVVNFGLGQSVPLEHVGQFTQTLRIVQRVSRESADALLKLMEGGEGVLTVSTRHLHVSVEVQVPFSGEVLFKGAFPLGEEAEARYKLGA